jgi:hypothetical protein
MPGRIDQGPVTRPPQADGLFAGLLVRPANRTPPVITAIPAILAAILAPHHPGRLGLGI